MNKKDDCKLTTKVMSFFEDLWNSIFQPGTNPQLLLATHASYASLILVLIWLCWETRNVHFFVLLAIASILWALVTWFVREIKNQPLKDNNQLVTDSNTKVEEKEEKEEKKQQETKKNTNKKTIRTESRSTGSTGSTGNTTATKTSSRKSSRTRSRKI